MSKSLASLPLAVAIGVPLVLTFAAASSYCEGAAPPPGSNQLRLKTDRVVVFKDGYALFVKTAEGTADAEGRVYTTEVPDGAVLGSFWAFADGRPSLAMRAEWIDRSTPGSTKTNAVSIVELLRANRGRQVRLALQNGTELDGKIADVLELAPPSIEALAATALPPSPAAKDPVTVKRELIPEGGQLVAVDTDRGRTVLPIAEIRALHGPGLETSIQRPEVTFVREKRLTFDLGPDAKNDRVRLHILYFTEGVRWIPTYRLGGELEKEGELVLQGEVLNEAEMIDDAWIDLVVGVPSFRFKNVPSPLALEQTLRSALARAAPDLMGQSMGNNLTNASFASRSGEWRSRSSYEHGGDEDGVTALAPELASSAGEQDLFVYHAKKTSLAKGARLALPLFAGKVPLRHIYTLDVAFPNAHQGGGSDPLSLEKNRVWHQLELTNPGQVPWTTGPVLLLQGNLPLGQELLTYTPKRGRTNVPVTIAVDVRAQTKEIELERKPGAYTWNHSTYAMIKKRGAITVRNDRDRTITVYVRAAIEGSAEKASHNGRIAKLGSNGVNPKSEVLWEVNLEPNETRELTTELTHYVP